MKSTLEIQIEHFAWRAQLGKRNGLGWALLVDMGWDSREGVQIIWDVFCEGRMLNVYSMYGLFTVFTCKIG